MTHAILLKVSFSTAGTFALFALLFVGLVGMYVYLAKLRRKARNAAGGFSLEVKAALDRMTLPESKLAFLQQTEERIRQEKAYQKNPDGRNLLLSKLYQHRAAVFFQAGRTREAVEACSEVIAFEPSHTQTYLNRGSLYGEMGEYQKAVEDFNQAELLDAHNPNIYNNRGWIYLQMKEFDKALSDLHHAISIKPTDIEHLNRANAFRGLGQYAKALDDYRESLRLHPQAHSELRTMLTASITEMEEKIKN